uniref:Uncharacterized protein n=1 Tax=Aegilops tauschii subsp. strangulata TaxID=200361 RepID=A0A453IFA4_AEGTS
MSRPSRSDAHLSPVDEAVRVDEVRGYYDGAAPKRHSKPSRSDHSAVYTDALAGPGADGSHPELDKFQDLEAHSEVRSHHLLLFIKTSRRYIESTSRSGAADAAVRVVSCRRNWCARAGRRARSSWRRSTTRTSAASASSITRLARASSRWTGRPAPRSSSPKTRMRRSAMLPPRETPPQTSGSRQRTR